MKDVEAFIVKARQIYGYHHFINDTGGSVCELNDDEVLEVLANNTVILYLRADKEMERKLIMRQKQNPKPLYFQEDFLDGQLAAYLKSQGLKSTDEIVPDEFVQWIFPKLVEHRRPLYQAIADQYGYTVEARDVEQVQNEEDFLELVASTLDSAHGGHRLTGEG